MTLLRTEQTHIPERSLASICAEVLQQNQDTANMLRASAAASTNGAEEDAAAVEARPSLLTPAGPPPLKAAPDFSTEPPVAASSSWARRARGRSLRTGDIFNYLKHVLTFPSQP